MYINDVISYMGAWEKIQIKHPDILDNINYVLNHTEKRIFDFYSLNGQDEDNSYMPIGNLVVRETEAVFMSLGWEHLTSSLGYEERLIRNLGVSKDLCFIRSGLGGSASVSVVMRWVFSDIAYVSKLKEISIPILLLFNISSNLVRNRIKKMMIILIE